MYITLAPLNSKLLIKSLALKLSEDLGTGSTRLKKSTRKKTLSTHTPIYTDFINYYFLIVIKGHLHFISQAGEVVSDRSPFPILALGRQVVHVPLAA